MDPSDDLKRLIAGIAGKTLAAKLRTLMPDIDRRVREGIQHQEIIDVLNAHGFDINLNTFRSYLYRYRKKVRQRGALTQPSAPTGAAHDRSPVEDSEAPAQPPALEDILDAGKREAFSEQYLSRKRPLFDAKRSGKK